MLKNVFIEMSNKANRIQSVIQKILVLKSKDIFGWNFIVGICLSCEIMTANCLVKTSFFGSEQAWVIVHVGHVLPRLCVPTSWLYPQNPKEYTTLHLGLACNRWMEVCMNGFCCSKWIHSANFSSRLIPFHLLHANALEKGINPSPSNYGLNNRKD